MVKIGVSFPQTSMPADRASIEQVADAVESLGYHHITAIEHVLGADHDVHTELASRGIPWSAYDVDSTFHEPLVLFAFLAARTSVELATGVVVLPQRQTALLAKQAANVDILCGGRLRLGVGVGWNHLEYEALDKPFHNRGKRIEEQIQLLRTYWTQRSVTFTGDYEQATGVGIAPRPVQRPIAIWVGGSSEVAYRRVGRVADGWFPQVPPGPKLDAARDIVSSAAAAAGRDPETIGMEGEVALDHQGIEKALDRIGRWEAAGATHITVNTMRAGFTSADQHVSVLTEIAARLSLQGRSTSARDLAAETAPGASES